MNQFLNSISVIQSNIQKIVSETSSHQLIGSAMIDPNFSIKGEWTERVIKSAFGKENCDELIHNNHNKGYDFKHLGNEISVKSGEVKNGILTISYSRTTGHKTLKTLSDKLTYLSSYNHLITGLCCEKFKDEKKLNIFNKIRYYLYYLPSKFIFTDRFDLSEWRIISSGKNINYQYSNNLVEIEIRGTMSSQPWIFIPMYVIPFHNIITSYCSVINGETCLTIENENTKTPKVYSLQESREKNKIENIKELNV